MLMDLIRQKKMNQNHQVNDSDTYSGGNYSDNGDLYYYDYDYFDIGWRARVFFGQPHNCIALVLGLCGIAANLLSVLAISRLCYATLSSHFRLLVSLALSDVVICLSVLLYIIIMVVSPPGMGSDHEKLVSRCFWMIIKALNSTGLNITLLNLMAMAIDHYVAILRPLHYPVLMSKKRSLLMVTCLWAVAVLCGFSDFFSAYPKYYAHQDKYNFCEFIYVTKYNEEYTIFATALIGLFVMLTLYIRIYQAVRKHHQRVSKHHEYNKNKKALITTLLILGTFIICWLPLCLFQIALLIQLKINAEPLSKYIDILVYVDRYLYNLLLLNTILDPIIYAVRVKEVQFGYKRLCGHYQLQRRRSARSFELSVNTACTELISRNPSKYNGKFNGKYPGINSLSATQIVLDRRSPNHLSGEPLCNIPLYKKKP